MKKKVLIVDDSPTSRQNLEVMFKEKNMSNLIDLYSAVSGFEGLIKVVNIEPDLIIMDWHMDGLDGLDTVYLLRSNEKYKNIPIIMLSGDGSIADKAKGLLIGADDFISKGLGYDDYASIINHFLSLK